MSQMSLFYNMYVANGFNQSKTSFLAELHQNTDKLFLLKNLVSAIKFLQSTT